ncbi:MAG: rhodanese-like domain-containing protein [Phycisphaerae bacterium]|nr:rhodanese-like domain-containing protein [Phycisphaerae bacterium]
MRNAIAIAVGWVCLVAGGCNQGITDKDIKMIGIDEVRRLTVDADKPSALLIDARPPRAYERARIRGARSVQLTDIRADRTGANPDFGPYKTLVVYGEDPGSAPARALAKRLLTSGYDGVRMFSGGFAEWSGAGLPVEGSGDAKTPDSDTSR